MPKEPSETDLFPASEAPPFEPMQGRPSSIAKKGLFIAALIALLAAGVWLTGEYATRTFLFPPSTDGRCFILEPSNCTTLTADGVEEHTGVTIPAGSEVVTASSFAAFTAQRVDALLAIPSDTEVGLAGAFEPMAGDIQDPRAITLLDRVDVTTVDSAYEDPSTGVTVWYGQEGDQRYVAITMSR